MVDPVEAFGTYDFGLAPAEEERASRLLEEAIVVDLTFSGPIGYRSFGSALESELEAAWERDRDPLRLALEAVAIPASRACEGLFPAYGEIWRASGITAGTRPVELASLDLMASTFGSVHKQCAELDWLVEARCTRDIEEAHASGRRAAIMATQLMAGPGSDLLGLLPDAHALGLRVLQLTYNTMTVVGAGGSERSDVGLSRYGAQVVARLNELGVVVDTAHCGRQTTLDACEISDAPVVASHSAARALNDHVRAKSGEELDAIAASGGVIGVVAVPFFLSEDPEPTVDSMLDHIDYLVNRMGVQHVAIGTDWPFPLPKSLLDAAVGAFARSSGFAPGDIRSPSQNLVGFDDYRDFPNVIRGLVKRGYSESDIQAIVGGNALRVFRAVWD